MLHKSDVCLRQKSSTLSLSVTIYIPNVTYKIHCTNLFYSTEQMAFALGGKSNDTSASAGPPKPKEKGKGKKGKKGGKGGGKGVKGKKEGGDDAEQ
jgi:hypothetical protein